MNSLCELRDLLRLKGVELGEFQGWWLDTALGRFTLAEEQLYCDRIPIDRKLLNIEIDLLSRRILTASEIKEWRIINVAKRRTNVLVA